MRARNARTRADRQYCVEDARRAACVLIDNVHIRLSLCNLSTFQLMIANLKAHVSTGFFLID